MKVSIFKRPEVRAEAICEDCDWTHFSRDPFPNKKSHGTYYAGRDNTRRLLIHHVKTHPGHKVKFTLIHWYQGNDV